MQQKLKNLYRICKEWNKIDKKYRFSSKQVNDSLYNARKCMKCGIENDDFVTHINRNLIFE